MAGSEITRIGSVPAFVTGIAAYNAGFGTIVGGPSGTQLDVPDTARVGSGFKAGENLNPGDAVQIFNGLVYQATGNGSTRTLAGQTCSAVLCAFVQGFASEQTQAGEGVTLWAPSVELIYTTTTASGTTLKDYYLSATVAGGLADAPSVSGGLSATTQPAIARYLGDGRIRIK